MGDANALCLAQRPLPAGSLRCGNVGPAEAGRGRVKGPLRIQIMSSTVVLARRYRPRTFEELVGQPHVVQALSNALTLGRLHHAYLFTGTRGIGKTTVSRILAKALNCVGADGLGGITATPCGQCAHCQDIDAGRFIDYVELDAASNRGVEEVSQLLEQAVYKPVEGRFKVFMIDEVHMLSTTAFNAMLKTLEEPPEYLKFILATTDPQKIPVTVLSRCLQFNLRPVNPRDIEVHLQAILEREHVPAQPEAVRLLSRFARGSMRDGLSLTDQAIAYGAGSLSEEVVRQMLGAVDRTHAYTLLEAVAAQDGPALLAAVDQLRVQGVSALATLEEIAEVLHRVAVAQVVASALEGMEDDRERMAPLAAQLARDETQLFYSMGLQGRSELAHAPDEYSGLTMVMLRMLAFRQRHPAQETADPGASTSTTLSRQEPSSHNRPRAEPAAQAFSVPSAVPPALRPAAVGVSEPARIMPAPVPLSEGSAPLVPAQPDPVSGGSQDRWGAWIQPLIQSGSIAALVRELAVQAQCVAIDAERTDTGAGEDGGEDKGTRVVTLVVERESLRSVAHRQRLEAALAEQHGQAFSLQLEEGLARDSMAIRETIAQQQRQSAAEALINNDEQLGALMQQYKGARIVPGSIKPIA